MDQLDSLVPQAPRESMERGVLWDLPERKDFLAMQERLDSMVQKVMTQL